MDSGLLIAGLIFVLVMLLGMLALYYSNLNEKRKNVKERVRKEAATGNNEEFLRDHKWRELLLQTVSRFGEVVRPKNEADISQIGIRLMRAGYHGKNGPVVFFGLKTFMAILLMVLVVTVKFTAFKIMPIQQFLLFLLLSVAAGFYLPDFYLSQRTKTRKRKIFEAFPDALDLMVVCVEAGMGLDAAIKRVGDEMALKSKDLGDEFKILSLELRVGKPRVEALRNLAMRTDLEDIAGLVTLLIQTDKFGTRVAQALRVHSDSMRTKRYQRAEEMAAKLPVKMVFPLIFFIFPSLFVAILGPAIIRMYRIFMNR